MPIAVAHLGPPGRRPARRAAPDLVVCAIGAAIVVLERSTSTCHRAAAGALFSRGVDLPVRVPAAHYRRHLAQRAARPALTTPGLRLLTSLAVAVVCIGVGFVYDVTGYGVRRVLAPPAAPAPGPGGGRLARAGTWGELISTRDDPTPRNPEHGATTQPGTDGGLVGSSDPALDTAARRLPPVSACPGRPGGSARPAWPSVWRPGWKLVLGAVLLVQLG